jgi:crotonobetainyl-CoA:carnitine CoA-transferase CaiB-like acyl-CoA transferase
MSAGQPPWSASMNALAGIRVLDLTHHIAGPHCAKLLADFGADVLKIERPPSGDPSRRAGPFYHDVPDPEASALFLHLNRNKRSLTLNLKTVEGRRIALRLLEQCDVLVENFRPGVLADLGLDVPTLHRLFPKLVVTSISNFGQTGPYRDLRASEITLSAMGGPMQITGHREHEPLKLGGNVVQYHAGAVAAYATLLAVYAVEGGRPFGEHIDISIYETQMGFRDRRVIWLTAYAYTGDVGRRPEAGTRPASGVRPAADGYVNIFGGGPGRFQRFLSMIGREDLLEDPRVQNTVMETQHPDLVAEIENSYLVWLMSHPKLEAAAIAQSYRLLAAPVNEIGDVVDDDTFNARGVFETIDHPATGPLKYPGRPFIMSASPRQPARRAPLLGEHTVEILEELGYAHDDIGRLRAQDVI